MESFAELRLADRVAAEFDRRKIVYQRVNPGLFSVPCSSSVGQFDVKLLIEPSAARFVVSSLFCARSEEEYKTVAYLNYRALAIGRLGLDVDDGEVRFEAELQSPDHLSVANLLPTTWALTEFARSTLSRVRFAGLTARQAVDASIAADARDRALRSIDHVAREAWERTS